MGFSIHFISSSSSSPSLLLPSLSSPYRIYISGKIENVEISTRILMSDVERACRLIRVYQGCRDLPMTSTPKPPKSAAVVMVLAMAAVTVLITDS